MKILLLADSRSYHTERYMKYLQQEGCDILLASIERGGLDHHPLPSIRHLPSTLSYAIATGSVQELIGKFQPQLINAHIASGYGYLMSRLSTNLPRVLHLYGSDILIVPKRSYLRKIKVSLALKKADVVVADSAFLLEEAEKLSNLESTAVIPWGIEKELLTFHKSDYTLGKPLKILVPRMHEPVYRNDFILDALSELINTDTIELTFSMHGSQYDFFRRKANSLCGDRVKFYEPMERREFIKYMSGFDIYLSASISDSSPVSLLEAMGLGLIPVVAMIEGIDEWISTESGYSFTHNNPMQLTRIIGNLCETGNKHEAMRLANRQTIEERAIFEENMNQQLLMFQKALG